jgi:hypothetical protein
VDLTNDVKPYMQWPVGSNSDDQLLQNTIDAACWWAQDFMGRPITPTEFFRRFNGYQGYGGSTIDLPYYPVLADPPYTLTVVEWWGSSGPHALVQQTPENQGGPDMFTLDPNEGLLTRSYMGLLQRPSFPGLKNIEVTWWAGFAVIPPHYRLGTLRLIKHWWDHDMQRTLQGFAHQEQSTIPHEYFPLIPDDILAMFATAQQFGIG